MNEYSREIIALWEGLLQKFPHDSLNQYSSLNETTKQWFTSIGVPLQNEVLINFYGLDIVQEQLLLDESFFIIGDDFGTKIAISNNENEIYSIDITGELPKRFINSGIKELMKFLGVYIKHLPQLQEVDDDEVEVLLSTLKKAFLDVDPKAMEDEDSWWRVILEQHEIGLM